MKGKRIRIRIEYEETELTEGLEVLKARKVEEGCFEIDFDRELELDIDTNDKALVKLGYAAIRDAAESELTRLAKKNASPK